MAILNTREALLSIGVAATNKEQTLHYGRLIECWRFSCWPDVGMCCHTWWGML